VLGEVQHAHTDTALGLLLYNRSAHIDICATHSSNLTTNICNAHCARFSIRPDLPSAHSLRQPFYAAKAAPLAQLPPWADSPGPLPPRTD